MNYETEVTRDERTIAAENQSYRVGFFMLTYGLIASVIYRSFIMEVQSWDLLGLVVLAGVFTTVYRGRQRALSRNWTLITASSALIAIAIAVVLLMVTSR